MKIFLRLFLVFVSLIIIGAALWLKTPTSPKIDSTAIKIQARNWDARIVRDNWGVPHIFGKTDADTSFGLGYAQAEDDWKTVQEVVIAARGMSAQYFGKDKAPADYLYDLFKVREAVEVKFDIELKPHIRAIAKAYADGLNLYAVENPDAVMPGVLPITDHDIIAGFTWATPFFYRLDGKLEELFAADEKPSVSPWERESALNLPEAVRGSNAFAIAPSRSDDGHTRLIVNSHQPMTGPYAWYEAHTVSEQGLNLAGAGFPGTPILTQGVTPHHGWVHTVNQPDLVDVYALEVDREKKPTQYKLDGAWRDFEKTKAAFRVKLFGPFSLPVKRDVLWSAHGPVLSTSTGHYAIKFSGLGEVRAIEQWQAMGKAQSFADWQAAIAMNTVLSFNITYADKNGNIGEIYNARMPKRIEGPTWTDILPGDQSKLIWQDFRNISELPQIWNPDSGWLFSANSTPFRITDSAYDNARADYSETFGIERRMTNRARRSLALFEPDQQITEAELLRYRADTRYHPDSLLMTFIGELVAMDLDDPALTQAQDILRTWDGDTQKESRGAALAVLTGTRALGYEYTEAEMDPVEALQKSVTDLQTHFGRLDPLWGDVNRIQRGSVNLPLDGAPDVLRAIYSDRDGVTKAGALNAFAGDTHIMYADWDTNGALELTSIHQYGSATLDETSPHYADQAPLFARGEYKAMPMTLEAVLPNATRDYRPGR